MKKYTIYACLLLLVGCSGSSEKSNKPTITVTIEPQRYFTEAIAGDKFTVECLVPKGTSPETYDPAPHQFTALDESKAYFRIGFIGFEQVWAKRLEENSPHIEVFDTSKGINLIYEAGHSHGDHYHTGSADPHVWNSTLNALIIAENICNALVSMDPSNKDYYTVRLDSLSKRIKETDLRIRQELASTNATHAFMIFHPALSYFARDYGLSQIPIEENGKEPSPAHLKELIDRCRTENVKVIFVQPEFDKSNAEIIAKETKTKVVPINPLNYNWEEEMLAITKALAHP